MTPRVACAPLKFLGRPRANRAFLGDCLAPGGTVYVAECG